MPLPKGRLQIVVGHFRADLQHQVGATRRPLHLLLLDVLDEALITTRFSVDSTKAVLILSPWR